MNKEFVLKINMLENGTPPTDFVQKNGCIYPKGWEENSIEEICEIIDYRGKTPRKTETGIFLLTAKNIKNGYIDYEISKEYISIEDYDNVMRRGLPLKGDIVFTTEAPLGNVAQIDNEKIAIAQRVLKLRSKKCNISNDFIKQVMLSDNFQCEIDKESTGSTVKGIKGSKFKKLKIVYPSLSEQNCIVRILLTWEKAIELKEKLIEEKKKQKSGLMQKLLTGKVRLPGFDGEWEFAELSTVCDKVTRCIDKPNEPYYRLGLRSHAKGTFHEYVENPSDNSMDKLYIVKENDLIVNITFAWEHAIALAGSDDDGKLVSHRFPTYLFKEDAEPRFYKHYVMQAKFKKMLDDISPGGAGRNRVMNQKSFLKLMVHVPPLVEQRAIADVLDLINKEISLHQGELDSLKQQKKGLMQLLLTGIVRVNVETN